MKYYNINNPAEKVSLRDAVLKSAVQVACLYMPENIPTMPTEFFRKLPEMNLQDIALEVSKVMLGSDISHKALEQIVDKAFNFDIPLKPLDNNLYVLELFHGPTLAFKDVGARFMAGLFEHFLQEDNDPATSGTVFPEVRTDEAYQLANYSEVVILVATSGDTGSAVANAFYNRKGIKVVILYPSGRVSNFQEKQLTTMGGNITAMEVDGDFDDCQRLVKQAFSDSDLNSKFNLTSANSINFARLFPQSFYYFYAYGQLMRKKQPVPHVVFSVPSGNFGNLTAGLIAKEMGLPVQGFIASCNSNHAVPDFLETGLFEPQPTKHTITNAMDVGNPSNFPRMLEIYTHKGSAAISEDISGYWFTDEQTYEGMRELQEKFNYPADPHGAVGYLGLERHLEKDFVGIFLETAHPSKFPESVEKATGIVPQIPLSMSNLLALEKKSIKISKNFEAFKQKISALCFHG
jgi:threonine synthase